MTDPEDPVWHCDEHRETFDDESPRGDKYTDDRTELAFVYRGTDLLAVLYERREVRRYRDETGLTVSLTPAGECRIEGNCQDPPENQDA